MATVKSFQVYDDASGAPAVIEALGVVYAFDYLGGLKCRCIRPLSGTVIRAQMERAANEAHEAYSVLLEGLGAEWIERNLAMYGV